MVCVVSTAMLVPVGRHDPQLVDGPGLEALVVEQLGVGEGVAGVGVDGAHAASPAARWSGWLAKMKSQRRSGDWVSTRSGLTWRMTRLMSRRSSMVGCNRPSGWPRKRTSVTPTSAAAARCSRWRSAAMSDAGHGAVGPAGVAVGGDAVGDLEPGRGEGGHGAGRPEVDVVGMGGHDQDAADPVPGGPDG
jgi:hypothetical protein